MATCRTAELGGHRAVCPACGAERITYNSCRNRHCPRCQRVATERWLTARRREVLPIPYFHVVFTLPHELNPLAQSHPRLGYRLLFQAAASTLLRFGRDPRHLGGTLGVTAVLHTWGQNLSQHLHVHCLVTGGALAPEGTRWLRARAGRGPGVARARAGFPFPGRGRRQGLSRNVPRRPAARLRPRRPARDRRP